MKPDKSPATRLIGVLDGAGRASVVEQPVPRLKRGQVLVKVRASLLSPGTELGSARHARQGRAAPTARAQKKTRPFGYQNAGDVLAVGAGVDQFEPGDRVCGFGGGYAYHTTVAVIPQNLCARLPDEVRYEQAAGGNLLLTALHAIRRGGTELGGRMLVAGMGLVGQLTAQLARLAGMDVMAWDLHAPRLAVARRCGVQAALSTDSATAIDTARAFTEGEGFDVAVVAFGGEGTGIFQSIHDVMRHTPDGHAVGRVVVVGGLTTTMTWASGLGNLDVLSSARTGPGYHDDDWEHGRSVYPPTLVRWTTRSNMTLMLRLIRDGRLDVDALITHRVPLREIARAVDLHFDDPAHTLGTVLTMD